MKAHLILIALISFLSHTAYSQNISFDKITPSISKNISRTDVFKIQFTGEIRDLDLSNNFYVKDNLSKITIDINYQVSLFGKGIVELRPRSLLNYGTFYEVGIINSIVDNDFNMVELGVDTLKFVYMVAPQPDIESIILNLYGEIVNQEYKSYQFISSENNYDPWTNFKGSFAELDLTVEKNSISPELNSFYRDGEIIHSNSFETIYFRGEKFYVAHLQEIVPLVYNHKMELVKDKETIFKVLFTFLNLNSTVDIDRLDESVESLFLLRYLSSVQNNLQIVRNTLTAYVASGGNVGNAIKELAIGTLADFPSLYVDAMLNKLNKDLMAEYYDAINYFEQRDPSVLKYEDAVYLQYVNFLLHDKLWNYSTLLGEVWKEDGNLTNQFIELSRVVGGNLVGLGLDPVLGNSKSYLEVIMTTASFANANMNFSEEAYFLQDYHDRSLRDSLIYYQRFDDSSIRYSLALIEMIEPSKPTLASVQLIGNNPMFSFEGNFSSFKAHQLEVWDSNNELVYNTGLILNSTDSIHVYSSGSYSGYDAITDDVRKSEPLDYGSSYTWRVRYLDTGDDWSEWSELGSFSIPNRSDVFDINLIYPNKTSYSQSETMTIQWGSALPNGTEYVVDLYKDDIRRAILSASTTSKSIQWSIPSDQVIDNNYSIKVYAKGDADIFDESAYFEITEPQANYDISIVAFSTSKSSTKPGNTISFNYQIFNSGNGMASGFTIDYLLRSEETGIIVEESGNYNNSISLVPNEIFALGGSIRAPDAEGIYLLEVSLNYSKDSKSGNNTAVYPVYVGNTNPYGVYLNGGSDVWYETGSGHNIHGYTSFNVIAYDDDAARVSLAGKTQTMEKDRIYLFDADRFALIYKGWFSGYGAVFRYYYQVSDFEINELRFEAQAGKITSVGFSATAGSNFDDVTFLIASNVNDGRRAALETWNFDFDVFSSDQSAGEIHFSVPASTARGYYDFFIEIDRKSASEYIQRVKVDVIDPVPDFSPQISKQKLTLAPGRSEIVEVFAIATNGFLENVSASVVGLPNGVTAAFINNKRDFEIGETIALDISVSENYQGDYSFFNTARINLTSDTRYHERSIFMDIVDDSQNFIAVDGLEYVDIDNKLDSLEISFTSDFSLAPTAITSNWQYYNESTWVDIPSNQIFNNSTNSAGSHSILWVQPSGLVIPKAKFRMKNKNGADFFTQTGTIRSVDINHELGGITIKNNILYILDTDGKYDPGPYRVQMYNKDDGTYLGYKTISNIGSDHENQLFYAYGYFYVVDVTNDKIIRFSEGTSSFSYSGQYSYIEDEDCLVKIGEELFFFYYEHALDLSKLIKINSNLSKGYEISLEYSNAIRAKNAFHLRDTIWVSDQGDIWYKFGPDYNYHGKKSGLPGYGFTTDGKFIYATQGDVKLYSGFDPYSFYSESGEIRINSTFPPDFIGSDQIALIEDQDYDTLNLVDYFSDNDTGLSQLSFSLNGISQSLDVVYDTINLQLAVRPKADVFGSFNFSLTASDASNSKEVQFTVSVEAVDDTIIAPISGKTIYMKEDQSIKLPLDSVFVDPDDDYADLILSVVSTVDVQPAPIQFSFNVEDEYLSISPNENVNGAYDCTLKVENPKVSLIEEVEFLLNITPVNDAPGSFELTNYLNTRITPGLHNFEWEESFDEEADEISYDFVLAIGDSDFTQTLSSNSFEVSIGSDFIGKFGYWQIVATDGIEETYPSNNYGNFYVVADSSALYPFYQVVKSPLVFNLDEDANVGTVFGNVLNFFPSDLDELGISVSENSFFNINNEGYLYLANPVDFEVQSEITLDLSVVYSGYDAIAFSDEITISIYDVNETPIIEDSAFNLAENSAVDTSVGTVAATDPEGDDLTYSIVSGNDLGVLQVDPGTGEITVFDSSSLDFESNPLFILEVNVTDGELSSRASITVNLDDLNEAPSIDDISFTVEENKIVGTSVGTVTSFDPEGDDLLFSIVSGNVLGAFDINPNTGEITVVNPILDFEINPIFTLSAEVNDADFADQATIIINLNDVNEAPYIEDATFTIDENSPIGTLVGAVSASDPDGNTLAFDIVSGNGLGAFEINSSTGAITVINSSPLDFEINQTFTLEADVTDGDLLETALITIDLNNIEEIFGVLEQDSLALIDLYYATNGPSWGRSWDLTKPVDEWYGVTIESGRVTKLHLANWNESGTEHVFMNLTGEIPNSFGDLSALIELHLGDNQLLTGSFPNGMVNLEILMMRYTGLEKNISHSIFPKLRWLNMAGSSLQEIPILISTLTSLEMLDIYSWKLTRVSPEITSMPNLRALNIGGSNLDHIPEITSPNFQSLTLWGNKLTFEDIIPILNANDFHLTYYSQQKFGKDTIYNVSEGDHINIKLGIDESITDNYYTWFKDGLEITTTNSNNYEIITAEKLDAGVYTVEVANPRASDLILTSNSITIKFNNPPIFEDQVFSLGENSPIGTPLGTVIASDPDGDALTYSIVSGNELGAFEINTSTGATSVADSSLLDFENNPIFSLGVEVSDGEFASTGNVTITVTDINESPLVSSSTFNVYENSSIGTELGSVSGIDPELDVLSYSIASGNLAGLFSIDSNTGVITISGEGLDYESVSSFDLIVEVSDGEFTSLENVTISIVDINESPSLSDATFTINENTTSETSVGVVSAIDPENDDLSFAITSGNDTGAFDINTNTGEITVEDAGSLDFETNPTLELSVAVSDGELIGNAAITITLTDINEAPSFAADVTFDIEENTLAGTVVGTVSASDPEGDDLIFSIVSGNDFEVFQINENSGELSVADASPFDFEVNPIFSLELEVSDGALSDQATITVNLNDQNESPIITPAAYTIDENSTIGTLIGSVDATDPDGDYLSYSIFSRDDFGAFELDTNSGNLVVIDSDPLDFESHERFQLHVRVTDGQISAESIIDIELDDINESPTDIILSSDTVSENREVGSLIGTLTSDDEDSNQSFTYDIVNGAELFEIDIDELLAKVSFDFEESAVQTVEITTTDQGGLTFSKTFEIRIIDVEGDVLGLDDLEDDITISPNPARDYVLIIGASIDGVRVFDMTGRQVLSASSNMIDVQGLASGVYTVVIDSDQPVKVKFIKE